MLRSSTGRPISRRLPSHPPPLSPAPAPPSRPDDLAWGRPSAAFGAGAAADRADPDAAAAALAGATWNEGAGAQLRCARTGTAPLRLRTAGRPRGSRAVDILFFTGELAFAASPRRPARRGIVLAIPAVRRAYGGAMRSSPPTQGAPGGACREQAHRPQLQHPGAGHNEVLADDRGCAASSSSAGPTSGYLNAEGVRGELQDLKVHQIKTYSAMQDALRMLVEDLDPAGGRREHWVGARSGRLALLAQEASSGTPMWRAGRRRLRPTPAGRRFHASFRRARTPPRRPLTVIAKGVSDNAIERARRVAPLRAQ